MLQLAVLLCVGVVLAQDAPEPATTAYPCSELEWHSPTTDSCLNFHDTADDFLSWADARKVCQENGGDLVKIVNEDMNADIGWYLYFNLFPYPYWIGYHDTAEEGKWTWLDEPAGSTNYTNWAADQPNNLDDFDPEGQNCAEIGFISDWEWNDYECNDPAFFICETPLKKKQEKEEVHA